MERYRGRVALVTGASAGLGALIAQRLVRHGMIVVGLARRAEKIKEFEVEDAPGKLYAVAADVTSEESVLSAFKWIRDNLGGVDVLINNAVAPPNPDPTSHKTEDWKAMLDVNVLGLNICTREAIKDMERRGVDDGFIIHNSSVLSHILPPDNGWAFYTATKHSDKILLEGWRKELVAKGSKIRIGQVSGGYVRETEALVKFREGLSDEAKKRFDSRPFMENEDIVDAIIYILSQHPRVQVYDIIITPTGYAP